MALDKAGLTATLTTIFSNPNNTAAQAASQIADAIDVFVKTGTVNPGITVQVVPASGTGATTGPGTIS